MSSGGSYDYPVSTTDLFVTTAALIGQELPERTYDGVDLVSKVANNEIAHDFLYYRKGFNQMIRTPEHKLIWNTELAVDTLLYNVQQDPNELNNIFEGNQVLVSSMLSTYDAWEQELQPPAWPSVIHFNFEDTDGKTYVFEN